MKIYYTFSLLVFTVFQQGRVTANTEAPRFLPGKTWISIKEDAAVGEVVFDSIVVSDTDTDNQYLQVYCPEQDRGYNPCDFFEMVPVTVGSSQEWRGQMKLIKQLDYEERPVYEITIVADDGVYKQYQTYTVNVTNVQDVPPIFRGSLSASVPEDVPIGTSVLQLTAVDGDGLGAQIIYTLLTNPENFFKLEPASGILRTDNYLDREIPSVSQNDGIVTLRVLASERRWDNEGEDAEHWSTLATVQISITDINDNAPLFSPRQYTVDMDENLPDGSTIPGLNIRVVDHDQGVNAAFDLTLEDHNDIFEVKPKEGQGALAVSIVIKNSSKIDYDFGQRSYNLRIRAKSVGSTPVFFSEGYVFINVEDVNDNKPTFNQPFYTATLLETAFRPQHVITIEADDLDQSDYYGKKSIRYKLTGEGASNFYCNRKTGEITVARPMGCFEPGLANCLDAEVKNFYTLQFSATDALAEGYVTYVPLNISITDVNDNRPKMELPDYVSYIMEDETVPDPEITVKAVDHDRPGGLYSHITYNIVGGQPTPNGLWTINANTGYVMATRPVPYPDGGYYLLTVEANDNYGLSDTATVKIFVEDINNHAPVFTEGGLYVQTIPEDTPPGTNVETITALDADPANTPGGTVRYRIKQGSRGKFVLDDKTGILTVAPGALFDYDVQNLYNLTVIAEDQGNPKLSSVAQVIIHILDSNNKKPVFSPTTVRADVLENAPLGEMVLKVSAVDLDKDANLRYSIIDPIRAWNRINMEIPNHPYKNWFVIDSNTGDVTVNNKLDRDKVIRWSATVKVQDMNGGANQTATGLIVITIVEVNNQPPIFALPWTPENPVIDVNVREGQAPGSYILTLVASDPADGVDHYLMLSNPSGFFDISEKTGVVTVAKPLDYEQMRSTQFVVVAVDGGEPALSSTATINVAITNINDETPVFSQEQYEKSIRENSPEGYSVVQVVATDRDDGSFGDVRYELVDPEKRFVIDERTGWITVAKGADLDREKQHLIVITARAYDSPNDEKVRKYVSVPVYITLLDVDEFPPSFGQTRYVAVVPETSPPDTSVIQLTASDQDDSKNNFIYQEVGGDPKDLFRIDRVTGLITTQRMLDSESGTYNISVLVRNQDGDSTKTDIAYVEITVLEMSNRPPEWRLPNPNNQTVEIYENRQPGMLVAKTLATDSDSDIVTYNFDVNGKLINKTEDFAINSSTGIITTRRSFNREEKDVYILTLVARDDGHPYGEAKQTLVVRILDVDDNRPQFPVYRNCCTVDYTMNISELASPNTWVVTVHAKDADLGENGRIIYSIAAGNEEGVFRIDPETGEVFLNGSVDHERTDKYALLLRATNPTTGSASYKPSSQCAANCTDPSSVYLFINILDHNEKPPEFSHQTYNACVSAKARFNTTVTRLEAIDPDKKSSEGVRYKIDSLKLIPEQNRIYAPDSFKIDQNNGTVYTNALLEMYQNPESFFKLKIRASDTNSSTQAILRIFVTNSDKEVIMTVNEKKEVVEKNLDYYKKVISEATGFSIVCIGSIRFHIDDGDGGRVDIERTDLYLHVIDPNSLRIMDPSYVRAELGKISGAAVLASASQWTGFIRDPVLIAVIIVAILLFIALLLLCCFCWCWSALFKKKQKYVEAPIVLNAGTINPLWKGFEVQELSMAVPEGGAKLQAMSAHQSDGYGQTDLNTQQISNGYIASHEEVHINEAYGTSSHLGATRIEAGLHNAASNHVNSTSTLAMSGLGTITRGVQTDGLSSALNVSTEYMGPGSPSRVGATLLRNGQYINNFNYDLDPDVFLTDEARTIGIQTYYSSQTYGHNYVDDMVSSPVDVVDNDYPESFYQGEIHLGTLPSQHQTSAQWQSQETVISSQEIPVGGEIDGEVEYVTFR